MRKRIPIVSIFMLMLLCVVAGWYFFMRDDEEAVKVLATAFVKRGSVTVQLKSTGIVQPQVGAIVKTGTRATGVIERMLVRVGDRVKKGVLIAKIDDREQRATYISVEANLKQAQAQLENVNKTFPLQINEAKANLEASIAQRRFAYLTWQRNKYLVSTKLEAQAALDEAYQNYIVAVNQVKANEYALNLVVENFATAVVDAVEGVVAAQANLDNANIQISYTQIYAPITGVVSEVTGQEGETVVSGLQVAALITMLDPSRLEMLIYVDETDVGTVARGMPVNFTVDAFPDVIFRGAVSQIYPEAVIRDNIVYYQALVPLAPKTALQLRPKMTTQCSIITDEKDGILVIPNEAIKWVGGKQYVYVVDEENNARPVSPKFGIMGEQNTQIVSGLEEGEKVAIRLVVPTANTDDDE